MARVLLVEDEIKLGATLEAGLSQAQHTVDLAVDGQEAPDDLVLSVADTGVGIGPEHLPRIFDRFYRADAARLRSTGGVGLGLAICQWNARAHQGSITVTSEPGIGTTFEVRLPHRARSATVKPVEHGSALLQETPVPGPSIAAQESG